MKIRKPLAQHLHAFTLMEIMLVVTIIALLAGLAIFKMQPVFEVANEAAAQANLRSYRTSLLAYKARAGVYPSTAQGLRALVEKPTIEPIPMNWKPVIEKIDKDPWGRDILWIGGGSVAWSGSEDSDFRAVKDGYVSVTPLHLDHTAKDHLADASSWWRPL